MALYPIAYGDDDIEVVELDLAADPLAPLQLNCCRFCNSSSLRQFAFFKHVFDVARDDGFVALEKLGHLVERQPDGIALEADFQPGASILGLEEDEFAAGRGGLRLLTHAVTSLSMAMMSFSSVSMSFSISASGRGASYS